MRQKDFLDIRILFNVYQLNIVLYQQKINSSWMKTLSRLYYPSQVTKKFIYKSGSNVNRSVINKTMFKVIFVLHSDISSIKFLNDADRCTIIQALINWSGDKIPYAHVFGNVGKVPSQEEILQNRPNVKFNHWYSEPEWMDPLLHVSACDCIIPIPYFHQIYLFELVKKMREFYSCFFLIKKFPDENKLIARWKIYSTLPWGNGWTMFYFEQGILY